MARLTQKDAQGNWCLRGVKWAQLHVGQEITREVSEKLYGALWKLMEYEDTGLTPEEVMEYVEMGITPEVVMYEKIRKEMKSAGLNENDISLAINEIERLRSEKQD